MDSRPPLKFYLSAEALASGGEFKEPRSGDAGFDLRSIESLSLEVGEQRAVRTGLHLAIPLGFVGLIRDRSSMASKRIYTHGGVIDAQYRGEVKVLISNQGPQPYNICNGDKVAQMIVVEHLQSAERSETLESLGDTVRGEAGFGSTGR